MLRGITILSRKALSMLLSAVIVFFITAFLILSSSLLKPLSAQAFLTITKTSSPEPVYAGNILTYTVTIVNTGTGPAHDVAVHTSISAFSDPEFRLSTSGKWNPWPGSHKFGAISHVAPNSRTLFIRGKVLADQSSIVNDTAHVIYSTSLGHEPISASAFVQTTILDTQLQEIMLGLLAVDEFTSPDTYTWTAPAGVTCIKVEAWGGGGGGAGSANNNNTHRGGGGGAYASSAITVVPLTSYTVVVGAGGAGGGSANGFGGNGNPSTFGVGPLVRAEGGSGGLPSNSGSGGAGGTVAGSIGDIRYRGGNAVAGGGGGAGSTGQGGDAIGNTGGTGTALYGGNGGNAPTVGAPGNPGIIFGGGGSGGRRSGSVNQPGGAGASGLVIITYIAPQNITPAGSYCFGNTVTIGLDGSETGVSYQLLRDGNPTGAPVNGTGGAISFGSHTATGVYTVLATNSSISCTGVMNGDVVILALPIVSCASIDIDPVCIDSEPITLAGATPAGGTYSGPGVAGGIFTPSVAGAGTHTITYTYTDINGCTNSCNFTITVNPLPVVTCPANMSVCVDDAAFALTGATPAGGTYSGAGVSGGNFDPSAAGVGTHTITYTYTDGNDCKNSCTFTITVNPLPTVTCPSDFAVCVDASPVTLTGGNPAGGSYSGNGVSGGVFNPSIAGVGTHTITYTYTDGNGCENSCTFVITVNPLPVVDCSSVNNGPVCIDAASFDFTGATPAGGTYSGPGISTSPTFDPSLAGAGAHSITYTYTDSNGCDNSCIFTITVNPLPSVTCPANMSVCVDAAVFTLTGASPAGGTYSGNGVSGGNFDPSDAGVGTHTITYTYTDSNGCTNACTFAITVNALPTVSCPANMSVCVDAAAFALTGASPSGGTYSGAGVSGGNFDPSAAGVGAHTITYTYTDGNGCTNSCTFTITVNDLPVVTCPSDFAVCVDAPSVTLSGGTPAGGTYSGAGVSGGSFNPSVAGVGNHTITYTYTDANGCVNSCTFTITVNPLPTVTCPSNFAVCLDAAPVTLSGGSPAGGEYTGTGVSGGVFNPSVAGVGSHTITYTFTDGNGCVNSCTFIITVNSLPSANITPDPAILCTYGSLTMNGNPAGGSGSYTTHLWTGAGAAFLSSVSIVNPVFSGAPAGSYDLVYTVTDSNGCIGSDDITITVNGVEGGEIASDQTICLNGDPAPFTSITPGSGSGSITYRWERSYDPFTTWTTIAGATGVSYDPNPPPPFTQTVKYRRVAISTLGGVACEALSNVLTVTVQGTVTPGSIGYHDTICHGEVPTPLVSVTAGSGSPSSPVITYIWEFSIDNGVTWNEITGATDPDYAPPALTQTTLYRRRTVSTLDGVSCISAPTNVVAVVVQSIPTPGTIAASQTICNGTVPAALTSVSGGTGSFGAVISYQWEQSTDGGLNWNIIAGATVSTYAPPALTLTTHYRRTTVATLNSSVCYSPPGNEVIITVQEVVQPGEIAANQDICYNEIPAPLTSVIDGSGSASAVIGYQWEYSIDNGATWNIITGADAAGYAPGALTQTTWYRRFAIATLNGVSCISPIPGNTVIITVTDELTAPVAGSDQTICYNTEPDPLSRTNASGGSGAFTYQWQHSTDNIDWTDIAGETGPAYQPPALTQTTWYRVETANAICGGLFYSNVVVINVWPELTAPTICCSQVVCLSSDPDPLTGVPASGGSGLINYQWQRSVDGDEPWVNIVGATNPAGYQPPSANWHYRLRAIDANCGTVFSNTVQIAMGASFGASTTLTYPIHPLCPGSGFSFKAVSAMISGDYTDEIKFSYTADPAHIDPPTGGPEGTVFTVGGITYFETFFIANVYNNTSLQVVTTITVIPGVYSAAGILICNLTPVTFNITINPFAVLCPDNIEQSTDAGNCAAQIAIPAIEWVPNSCTAVVAWEMAGATTGSGTGNIGMETFEKGVTTITYTAQTPIEGSDPVEHIITTCSFTVTVTDDEVPVIACPDDILLPVESGCTRVVNYVAPVGTDNCPGAVTVQTAGLPSGSAFPVGTTTNTFVVTDAAGNVDSCSFTITITDDLHPVFGLCPGDYTVNTSGGECSAFVNTINPVVTDNCEVISLTWAMTGATTATSPATGINYVGFFEFNEGITTVTYTASDAAGNSSTCEFTVTVTDNEPPIIICPMSYYVSNDPGMCSSAVGTTAPFIDDNCGITDPHTWTMTGATIANGSGDIGTYTFNVGTTFITYFVTDNSGNTSQCSFVVEVDDDESPVLTCPAAQTRETDPGVCTYTVTGTEFDPELTDNCGIATVSLSNNFNGLATLEGAVFPLGTTNVVWLAIDEAGNSSTCNFNVTIEDNEDPTITCVGDQAVNTNAGDCTYTHNGFSWDATGSDNCSVSSIIYVLSGSSSGSGNSLNAVIFNLGITTVTWTITDGSGNTAECEFTVSVNDGENPTINCPGNQTVSTDPDVCTYTHTNNTWDATGSDNCSVVSIEYELSGSTSGSGISLNGVTFNLGVTTVTWTITDGSGNTAECSYTVMVQDNELPTITCPGNQIVNTDASACTYTHNGTGWDATGSDNCSVSSIIYVLSGSSSGSGSSLNAVIFNLGVTTVTWTITDGNGNTATCSFTVTVEDNEIPIINCVGDQLVDTDPGVCTYTHTDNTWDATGSDNCNVVSIEYELSGSTSGSGTTLNGAIFNLGVTTVTWTITDGSNNTATCAFDVVVADTELPHIVCRNDTLVYTPGASCQRLLQAVYLAPVSYGDNCGILSLTWQMMGATTGSSDPTGINFIPNTHFQAGITTVTYTITDVNGNVSSCSWTITVVDNVNPEVTCPDVEDFYPNDPGHCHASLSFTATATDNCEVDYIKYYIGSAEITFPYNFPVGSTEVTVIATDVSGNTSLPCTFNVVVMDTQPPVLTCPTPMASYNAGSGLCYRTLSFTASATDNCGMAHIKYYVGSSEITFPYDFPVGITTVTVIATDIYDNTSQCTFNVNVIDNQPPTVVCPVPATFTRFTPPDACSYTIVGNEFDLLGYNDNCGVVSVTYQLTGATTGSGSNTAAGVVLNVGTTVIRWYVADAAGWINSSCVLSVQVVDNVPPVFLNCEPYIYVECPEDYELPDASTILAFDNCGGFVTVTVDTVIWYGVGLVPGFCPDSVLHRFKAVDASGNVAYCNQMVIVLDPCDCELCQKDVVPNFYVNLEDKCDSVWVSPSVVREGCCCPDCGGHHNNRCVSFQVKIGPHAVGFYILMNGATPPAFSFQVNCGPEIPLGTILCVPPGIYHTITICKPGGNANVYSIHSVCGLIFPQNMETRIDCERDITVTGVPESTITWHNITGDYLHYLSGSPDYWTNPDGNSTVFFTADTLAPSIIQYLVCGGFPDNPCATGGIICDTVTIHVHPLILIDIDPYPPVFCHNDPKPIVASVIPVSLSYLVRWYDEFGTLLGDGTIFHPPDSGLYYVSAYDPVTTLPCSYDTMFFYVEYMDCLTCPPEQFHCSTDDIIIYSNYQDFVDAGATYDFPCEVAPATFNLAEVISDGGFCPEIIIHRYALQDICGNRDTCDVVIIINDLIPPTFNLPADTIYCVEDLINALYNPVGIYPIDDLTYPRPDYYLHLPGNTILDLVDLHDNCTAPEDLLIEWEIDFGHNGIIDMTGTGQLSEPPPIYFPLGTNAIHFTVTDECGNSTSETLIIVVRPRPDIQDDF